jgi:hypothetical protein
MKLQDIIEDLAPDPSEVTDVMRTADDHENQAVPATPYDLKKDKPTSRARGHNHKEAKRIVATSRTKARAHPYKTENDDKTVAALIQSSINGWDD